MTTKKVKNTFEEGKFAMNAPIRENISYGFISGPFQVGCAGKISHKLAQIFTELITLMKSFPQFIQNYVFNKLDK